MSLGGQKGSLEKHLGVQEDALGPPEKTKETLLEQNLNQKFNNLLNEDFELVLVVFKTENYSDLFCQPVKNMVFFYICCMF